MTDREEHNCTALQWMRACLRSAAKTTIHLDDLIRQEAVIGTFLRCDVIGVPHDWVILP